MSNPTLKIPYHIQPENGNISDSTSSRIHLWRVKLCGFEPIVYGPGGYVLKTFFDKRF